MDGETALMVARQHNERNIAAYMVLYGAIDDEGNEEDDNKRDKPYLFSICQKDFTQKINSKFQISNREKVTPLQQHKIYHHPSPFNQIVEKTLPLWFLFFFL